VDARPPAVAGRVPIVEHAACGRRFRIAAAASALAILLVGCSDEPVPSPQPVAQALPPPSSIGDVQGTGPRSPYEGLPVRLTGVVTGNFVAALDGFFMQDEAGAEDGDPRSSDAIFVEWSREQQPKLRRGDRVRVDGRVAELGDGPRTQTALVDAAIEVLGRAGVALTVLEEPPVDEADWERFEAMWLRIGVPLTVAGNRGLDRHGQLEVAFGGRPRAPTARYAPGPRAEQRAARNALRMFVLDDARRGEYPERLWFLPDGIDADAPLRVGSRLHEVEGILDHRAGRRLQLTTALRRIEQAPRPPPPDPGPGLRLATFNLQNLFNGDGAGGGFPTARGAASHDDYLRQQARLVAMIAALAPDAAALVELENDGSGPDSAQQQLVDALNAALGDAGDYRGVPFAVEQAGADPIRVGLIYRSRRLRAVGEPQVLRDGPFAARARPPLAQAFAAPGGGPPFTLAAAHFKSKGGCHEVPAAHPEDIDRGDGQSCFNGLRTASAEALGSWLAADPAATGSGLYAILGDLNANTFEDPLQALRRLGYRDAIAPEQHAVYTYIHRGQSNRLDHALLSPALARRLVGAAVWHVNAAESERFGYRGALGDDAGPFRAADHDPVLVVLKPQ
jgi:uncharacterized protein